jgi:O-antigen/teichoic acid export membrane protein
LSSEPLLPWLAGTVAILSAFIFLVAILNALREIGKLALLQLASPLVAAVVAWPVAIASRAGHPVALVLFLAIPAAATIPAAVVAMRAHRDRLRGWFQGPGRWWSLAAARSFLSISGAMLASGLVATTVLLAVRGSITRQEGLPMTGQFDAAWNISMNQVMLILGSVQAYYLPTLAASKSAGERGRQIRGMLMVATLATVPAIVALAALKPLAVSLLYSSQFAFSPGFLRWTLLGDYLKVSAWVLATPMLATRDAAAFLGSDLVTQAVFFGSAICLARIVKPAEGAAIGFLASYAVYFSLCYGYARLRHGFRFGATGLSAWLTGLVLIIGASANAWSDTTPHFGRAACWIVLAMGFSAGFAMYIRRRDA